MKYHLLYKERLFLTCDNEAACEDNLKGMFPLSMHKYCRIISHDELTIKMTK